MEELTKQPDYYTKQSRCRIVRIAKNHPYYRTSNNGNISEARLIMAMHLHRNLTKDDIVYFKDGDHSNVTITNLIVLTRREFCTVRELKRFRLLRDRLNSNISTYERYLAEAGIDPSTFDRIR